ncbi:MAG: hypothetical protein GX786_03820 [Clostridiales bacterium]|nr:hypothetical protein [Clostridiales bacterium]
MSDHLPKPANKPSNILQDTIQMFKGKGKTEELIEEFTNEVSIVTEGLWNDQKNLKTQMDTIQMEQTLWENKEEEKRKKAEEKIGLLEKEIKQLQTQMDQDKRKKKKEKNIVAQISMMVFVIAGAWVLVTLVKAFFP